MRFGEDLQRETETHPIIIEEASGCGVVDDSAVEEVPGDATTIRVAGLSEYFKLTPNLSFMSSKMMSNHFDQMVANFDVQPNSHKNDALTCLMYNGAHLYKALLSEPKKQEQC